jgi:hypothetical protein
VRLRNSDITGERTFEEATHRIPIDRGNHQGTRVLQRLECRAETRRRDAGHFAVTVREGVEVRSGTKEFRTVAGDHDGADPRVAV